MLIHIKNAHIRMFSEKQRIQNLMLEKLLVPNYIIYTCTQTDINNSWHLMSAYFVSDTELRIFSGLFH